MLTNLVSESRQMLSSINAKTIFMLLEISADYIAIKINLRPFLDGYRTATFVKPFWPI
jgi:hypothetical protein